MTIPNRVRASVERLGQAHGSYSETIDRVDARGTPDDDLKVEIAALVPLWRDGGYGEVEAIDAVGDPVDFEDLAALVGELRITWRKRQNPESAYLLTPIPIAVLLADFGRACTIRAVFVAEPFAPFSTATTEFQPWADMAAASAEPHVFDKVLVRRLVRDLAERVPWSVGPLLLERAPDEPSPVFEAWTKAAVPQLILTLTDEVWLEAGSLFANLIGPRKRRLAVRPELFDPERDRDAATEAAGWVYGGGQDVEARHILFTNELAREWQENVSLAEGFVTRAPAALEAARAAYRLHLHDTSKDTLKSLGELRKSLTEDVQRVMAQTRELITILSRDFLVAATALIARFVAFAAVPASAAFLSRLILLGSAAFLAFSYLTSLLSNAGFNRIAGANRAAWKAKLYNFLDPKDYQSLAEAPLSGAVRVYRFTLLAIGVAYALLIWALLSVADLPPPEATENGQAVQAEQDAATNGHATNGAQPLRPAVGQAAPTR